MRSASSILGSAGDKLGDPGISDRASGHTGTLSLPVGDPTLPAGLEKPGADREA